MSALRYASGEEPRARDRVRHEVAGVGVGVVVALGGSGINDLRARWEDHSDWGVTETVAQNCTLLSRAEPEAKADPRSVGHAWRPEGGDVKMLDYFVSFDVESNGLHGAAFAVGAVAVHHGVAIESCFAWSDPRGTRMSIDPWVTERVIPALVGNPSIPVATMRAVFCAFWLRHKAAGAVLVADCPWPVESHFLDSLVGNCMDRDDGPYPLIDVASVRLARGLDPLATCERLPNELPVHNPLADARQSARLLIEAMR